ncbi:MAG: virion core protein, T7 gp14 family [Citrobacter telavivensis]
MGVIAGAVMAGMSVLSSVKKSQGEASQAKANEAAQRAEWIQRLADTRENYKQIAQEAQQVNQEANQNIIQNQMSLAQQKAEVELMAAASGTGGQSVSAMMTDLSATAGRNSATIIQNAENQQQSISNQLRAVQKGGAVEFRKFDKPSASNTIFGAVGSGLSGYLTGSQAGKALGDAYTSSRRGSNIKLN